MPQKNRGENKHIAKITRKSTKMPRKIRVLLLAVFSVPPLVFAVLLIGYFHSGANRTDLGQLGDYFGGLLNPLIAYAACTAILISATAAARTASLPRRS